MLKMGITVAKTPKMMAMLLSVESALGTSRTMVAAKLVRTGCQFNCPEVQALTHAGGRVCWSGLVLNYGQCVLLVTVRTGTVVSVEIQCMTVR